MKISEYFDLRELVHPEIYESVGDRSINFLNHNLVTTLEDIRRYSGAITVNNWHYGDDRRTYIDSGLRSAMYPLKGRGTHSGHYFGVCADLKVKDNKDVYFHILNKQHLYPYILRIESIDYTSSWVHIEVSTDKRDGQIYVFNP